MILCDDWVVLLLFLDLTHATSICWWINWSGQNIWTFLSPSQFSTQASSQHNGFKIPRERMQKYQASLSLSLKFTPHHFCYMQQSKQVTGPVKIQGVKKIDSHSLWEEWQHHNVEGGIFRLRGIVAIFALYYTQVIGSFKQNPDIVISNISSNM